MNPKRLDELDLPFLAVEDPAFGVDPRRHFTEARTTHPWLARSNIGMFVHEYTAIRELLGRDDLLRPAYDGIVEQLEAKGTPWGRFTQEQLISLPADKHRLLRDLFARKFTPRNANALRPMMRGTITRLLDQWASRQRFDFEELASFFPISNMFTMVGAPVEKVPSIRDSLETLGSAFAMDKDRVPEIHQAFERLESLVLGLIAERRANPEAGNPDDLLHLLINTGDEGGITERQLADLVIFFFIAGYDTSKNVLTYTLYQLLNDPEAYRRCGEDYEYCQRVVEEALRYFNPGSVPRFTREDITFRDVLLPRDTMLWFTLNISGRDPGIFDEPDRFDPERPLDPQRRHMAFSLGKHMCLGQYIARAQLQEAIHLIPQRLRNPRLAGEVTWRLYPGAWGIKSLPIECEFVAPEEAH